MRMRRAIVWTGLALWLAACGGDDDQGVAAETEKAVPVVMESDASHPDAGAQASHPAEAMHPTAEPAAEPSATDKPAQPNTPPAQDKPKPQDMPMAEPTPPAADMPKSLPTPWPQGKFAMDECGLHTGWKGDEYCILPPPPEKGFQLHIGPSNYDKPDAVYVLKPGQESVHTFTATSGNDHDIDFYFRQYRMRPGAHHTIVRDTSTGRRLSGSNVNQDHPINGIVAPENVGIGLPLTAHAPISVDHHAINTTDQPLLQEVWVNFWYVDPAKVTETTTLLYDPGDFSATVAPKADVVLGPYECDIKKPGRLISMFGHVHANNVRFSAWRVRNGQRDLIYESHHWEEPLWLEFTSLAKNPVAMRDQMIDGGWSGILDLQAGDTLAWECHEVNQQQTTLRFVNQTYTGTMCIIIGDLVGTKCENRSGFTFNPNLE